MRSVHPTHAVAAWGRGADEIEALLVGQPGDQPDDRPVDRRHALELVEVGRSVAELAIERAKRLVELGHDVVILLDGITGGGTPFTSIEEINDGLGYDAVQLV